MLFEKTSSQQFSKFGDVRHNIDEHILNGYIKTTTESLSKSIVSLFVFPEATHVEVTDGLALIVIKNKIDEKLSKFVIHGCLEIKPNIYFNVIPITDKAVYNLYTTTKKLEMYLLEESYTYDAITPKIKVEEILAYHYNIKSPKYSFDGESHEFYELTYVDYGELETNVDGVDYQLKTFNLFIYGPNQFHNQRVPENTSCSYLTIMFKLEKSCPKLLLNKIFTCDKEIHDIFKNFSKLSTDTSKFTPDLLVSLLNLILVKSISLNFNSSSGNDTKAVTGTQDVYQNELLENIIKYINDRIYEPITIAEICKVFSISRSSLQTLFNDNLSTGPKKYINNIKLTRAKQLIKENKYTISEIAFLLGFNSIHYFSRSFTKHYEITPTDYAKKVYKS